MSRGKLLLVGLLVGLLGAAPGFAGSNYLTVDGTMVLSDAAAFEALGITQGEQVRLSFKLKKKDKDKENDGGIFKVKRYEVLVAGHKLKAKTKTAELRLTDAGGGAMNRLTDAGTGAMNLQLVAFAAPAGKINKQKVKLNLLSVTGSILSGTSSGIPGANPNEIPQGVTLTDLATAVGPFQILSGDVSSPNLDINVAQVQITNGRAEAFVMEPIPEPATAALMTLGLAGLAMASRRRV